MSEVQIVRMDESHLHQASEMLARAFYNDAEWAYVFYDEATRLEQATWFWYRFKYLNTLHNNEAYVALIDNKVVGLGSSVLPTDDPVTLRDKISVGILKIPFMTSFKSFYRMLELETANESLTSLVEPTMYVDHLAVDPSVQGKGIGKMLIQKLVDTADERFNGKIILTTNKDSNIQFYSKFGFQVLKTREATHVPLSNLMGRNVQLKQ
jgi:ribosomal protein S18 acetylase RimI-like enzyme